MIEFSAAFALGAALATAICWWRWKSTADERSALKAKIQRLEDDISTKFKGS